MIALLVFSFMLAYPTSAGDPNVNMNLANVETI